MVVVTAGVCAFAVSWVVGDVVVAFLVLKNALDRISNRRRRERKMSGSSVVVAGGLCPQDNERTGSTYNCFDNEVLIVCLTGKSWRKT